MKFRGILAGLAMALLFASGPVSAQEPLPRMAAVKLAVTDFERTAQFYWLLGMDSGSRHNEWEWELTWDDPAKGSSIIMVNAAEAERFHVTPGGGTLIIATPDVYSAIDLLKVAGFDVEGEPRNVGSAAIIMIQDPDGN